MGVETYNTVHLNDYTRLMPSEIAFGFVRIGMVFKIRIGLDSDWIISDRIRILKFTNYWELSIRSDAHLYCTCKKIYQDINDAGDNRERPGAGCIKLLITF